MLLTGWLPPLLALILSAGRASPEAAPPVSLDPTLRAQPQGSRPPRSRFVFAVEALAGPVVRSTMGYTITNRRVFELGGHAFLGGQVAPHLALGYWTQHFAALSILIPDGKAAYDQRHLLAVLGRTGPHGGFFYQAGIGTSLWAWPCCLSVPSAAFQLGYWDRRRPGKVGFRTGFVGSLDFGQRLAFTMAWAIGLGRL
jgi:hypothetical protein